jgi:hypothetical protein
MGIQVGFSDHVIDRMNNNPPRKLKNSSQLDPTDLGITDPIDVKELEDMFAQEARKHRVEIKKWVLDHGIPNTNREIKGLFTDTESDIHLPFAIKWNPDTEQLELTGITVMRKIAFGSGPVKKVFTVEDVAHQAGTFGCLKLHNDQALEIYEWCQSKGIDCQEPDELHCTVMFSERPCPELMKFHRMPFQIPARVTGYRLMGPALAITLDSSGAHEVHNRIMQHSNATYPWPSYIPHMSLNYNEPTDVPEQLPMKNLMFTELHVRPLDANFAK